MPLLQFTSHTDASLSRDSSLARFGYKIQQNVGGFHTILQGGPIHIQGIDSCSSNMAELYAVGYALFTIVEFVERSYFKVSGSRPIRNTCIIFYTDSRDTVNSLKLRCNPGSDIHIPIFNSIQSQLSLLHSWDIVWLPREHNHEANRLAGSAGSRCMGRSTREQVKARHANTKYGRFATLGDYCK